MVKEEYFRRVGVWGKEWIDDHIFEIYEHSKSGLKIRENDINNFLHSLHIECLKNGANYYHIFAENWEIIMNTELGNKVIFKQQNFQAKILIE